MTYYSLLTNNYQGKMDDLLVILNEPTFWVVKALMATAVLTLATIGLVLLIDKIQRRKHEKH